jgi:CHAT domain-containing protein/Tfp pilus assembly protein PilF
MTSALQQKLPVTVQTSSQSPQKPNDLLEQANQLVRDFESSNSSMTSRDEMIDKARTLIAIFLSLQNTDLPLARTGICNLLRLNIETIPEEALTALKLLLNDFCLSYDVQTNQFQHLLLLEDQLSLTVEFFIRMHASKHLIYSLLERYEDIIERLGLLPFLTKSNKAASSHVLERPKRWLALLSKDGDVEVKQMIQDTEGTMQKALQPPSAETLPILSQMAQTLQSPIIAVNFGSLSKTMGNLKRAIYHYQQILTLIDEIESKGTLVLGQRKIRYKTCIAVSEIYETLQDIKNAVVFQERATFLARAVEIGADPTQQAILLSKLGSNFVFLREYAKAKNCFLEGLEIAQRVNLEELEIALLQSLGEAYSSLQDHSHAIDYFTRTLSKLEHLGDDKERLGILLELIKQYNFLGEHLKVKELIQKALFISARVLNKSELGTIYLSLGIMYEEGGQYPEAIEMLMESLKLAQNAESEGFVYSELGNVYDCLGDYDNAIKFHGLSLEKFTTTSNEQHMGTVYGNLGLSYRSRGDYRRALHLQKQALSIAEKFQDNDLKARVLANTGAIFQSLGEYGQAHDQYKIALTILESLEESPEKGKIYGNLGNAFCKLGDYEQALVMQNRALQVAQALHDRRGEANAYGNIGGTHIDLGCHEIAEQHTQKALDIFKAIGDRRGVVEAATNLGWICRAQKKYDEAFKHYHASLELAISLNLQHEQAVIYANMATTHQDMGRLPEAEAGFRKSIDLFAALQDNLEENSQSKITIFEEQAIAYMGLESILIAQKKYLEALVISDSRRARALISKLLKKSSSPQVKTVALDPAMIQGLAQQHQTTFVIYSMASLLGEESKIGAWIVPPEGPISWQNLPTEALEADAKDLKTFFKSFPFSRSGESNSPSPKIVSLADLQELSRGRREDIVAKAVEKLKVNLSKWYTTLILPIEPYLPQKPDQNLTIIPDNFLSHLPFAAFRDPKGSYLIERYSIRFVPSMQTLQVLGHHPDDFAPSSLVVGNPTTPNPTDMLLLAEREAILVGDLLKTPPERVLLREKPTVSLVLQEMEKSRWIHFACHGLTGEKPEERLDPHSVFGGLLKLTPDPEHLQGHLYAQELVRFNLKTELVFLSACYSGTGKLQKEGNIGLVWSFLAAGALSTIATYWPLPESETTVQVVETFYQGVLLGKLSKAKALRKALLKAIEKERENLRVWGAFFLTGLS